LKIIFYIGMLCALLICCVSCTEPETSEAPNSSQQDLPDQEIWDFKVTMTDKGYLEAELVAGHMSRFEKKSLAIFDQGVEIQFYNRKGEITSTLTSHAGELDEYTNNVKAVGNVIVESDSGITLYTNELFYYNEQEKIASNVDVMVTTTDGDTLYGIGFESDTRLDYWEIKKPHDGVSHTSVDLTFDPISPTSEDSADVDTSAVEIDTLDNEATEVLP